MFDSKQIISQTLLRYISRGLNTFSLFVFAQMITSLMQAVLIVLMSSLCGEIYKHAFHYSAYK